MSRAHSTGVSRLCRFAPSLLFVGCPSQTPAPAPSPVQWHTAHAATSPAADQPEQTRTAPAVVFGPLHDQVRDSLCCASIERVERGPAGRSVNFKVTFDDGTVGFFKPEQTYAAHWYSELAAYYIDRALGLGRVPPAVGRRVPWERLREVAAAGPHADEVVVGPDGTVRGAMMWWVPTKLVPLDPPPGWEAWLSVDGPPAVSPFRRPSEYRRARKKAEEVTTGAASAAPTGVAAPRFTDRPAELSDLILFDFLIGNHDRWGGHFTNVRTLGRGGPIVYIDNANGFPAARRPTEHDTAKLAAAQRMRARTVDAIDALDIDTLRATLAEDPLDPVLSQRHLDDLKRRRRAILDHARRMRDEHGKEAMPW